MVKAKVCVLTVTLFIITRKQKHFKCPLTDEWKMNWGPMKYYSAVKKSGIVKIVSNWMELKEIMFNEETQP